MNELSIREDSGSGMGAWQIFNAGGVYRTTQETLDALAAAVNASATLANTYAMEWSNVDGRVEVSRATGANAFDLKLTRGLGPALGMGSGLLTGSTGYRGTPGQAWAIWRPTLGIDMDAPQLVEDLHDRTYRGGRGDRYIAAHGKVTTIQIHTSTASAAHIRNTNALSGQFRAWLHRGATAPGAYSATNLGGHVTISPIDPPTWEAFGINDAHTTITVRGLLVGF